jgi:hypothetical protein
VLGQQFASFRKCSQTRCDARPAGEAARGKSECLNTWINRGWALANNRHKRADDKQDGRKPDNPPQCEKSHIPMLALAYYGSYNQLYGGLLS